jgi:hypothetical protein
VYAIGYPGDKTTQLPSARGAAGQAQEHHAGMPWHVKFGAVAGGLVGRFKQAGPRQRALYAGTVAISVALIGALALKLAHNGEAPVLPGADQVQAASGIQPVSAVALAAPAAPHAESKAAGTGSTAKPAAKKSVEGKTDSQKAADQTKHPAAQPKIKEPASTDKKTWLETIQGDVEPGKEAYLSISCKEGTQLFVDGAEKIKVVPTGLTVAVTPGAHKIIVTSKSGALYTKNVDLMPGKTVHIKPNFCD